AGADPAGGRRPGERPRAGGSRRGRGAGRVPPAAHCPGKARRVLAKLAARHGPRRERPRRTLVGEEGTRLQRAVARLLRHLLLTPHCQQAGNESAAHDRLPHCPPRVRHVRHSATSETSRGPSPARNCRVASGSNFGSDASMHRKNRSVDARAKRSTLKTGWYGVGRRLRAKRPRTAASAAHSTVISNVTGMNEGQLLSG